MFVLVTGLIRTEWCSFRLGKKEKMGECKITIFDFGKYSEKTDDISNNLIIIVYSIYSICIMDSKKFLIDFSSTSKCKGKGNPMGKKENKKIEMEKERKKRVVTETNQWIKTELTSEQELEVLQQIKTMYDSENHEIKNHEKKNNTSESSNITLVLQQLKYKIGGYRNQDIEKNKYCEEKFVSMKHILELLISCNNNCYYCKKPTKILYDFVREPQQWTLDRMDNEFGHNYDNVSIACLQCNLRRKTMYHERYLFTKQMIITKTG